MIINDFMGFGMLNGGWILKNDEWYLILDNWKMIFFPEFVFGSFIISSTIALVLVDVKFIVVVVYLKVQACI